MMPSYIETMAGAPNNTPEIEPNMHPDAPMKSGAMMYPGMMDFRFTPSVRRTAISLAWD